MLAPEVLCLLLKQGGELHGGVAPAHRNPSLGAAVAGIQAVVRAGEFVDLQTIGGRERQGCKFNFFFQFKIYIFRLRGKEINHSNFKYYYR